MKTWKKIPATERNTRVSYAIARGRSHFPFDMLRYDNCRPAREEDSRAMAYDSMCGPEGDRFVLLVKEHGTDNPWTTGRWKSQGWRIVGLDPETASLVSYRHEKIVDVYKQHEWLWR